MNSPSEFSAIFSQFSKVLYTLSQVIRSAQAGYAKSPAPCVQASRSETTSAIKVRRLRADIAEESHWSAVRAHTMPAAIYGMITRRQNSGKAYSVRCSDNKWGIEMAGLLPRDGNSSAQMENAIKEFQIEKTFPGGKAEPATRQKPA